MSLALEPVSSDVCGLYKMPRICDQHDCGGTCSRSRYPQLENPSERLRTFAMWPAALQPRPKALVDAGFFYTGQGDRCVCFSCGTGLKDWEVTDDPWVEHQSHFPKCPFLVKEIASGRLPRTNLSPSPVIVQTETAVSESGGAEALLCKVCYLQQMCVTFLPCKHVSTCESCASCLKQCPVCREGIQSSFKVYLQ